MAEGGGLLNRYRVVKPYRGFESLRLRQEIDICEIFGVTFDTLSLAKVCGYTSIVPVFVRPFLSHFLCGALRPRRYSFQARLFARLITLEAEG